MGLGDELDAQRRDQAIIEFDGDDTTCLGSQVARKRALTGTDLDDGVILCQIGGSDDARKVGFVGQEVLTEGFFGGKAGGGLYV